jgi:Lrp/AsnC family transcriptional regulator for asnA, asnC and gidA
VINEGIDNLSSRVKIDEVDIKILKALLKDPRISFAKIAKQCEMSINAVRSKFKRLEELDLIKGSIMQINPKYWGYNCIAYLMIRADANAREEVLEFLINTPKILHTFQQIGRTNIHCLATLKNVDELAHTLEDVKKHSSIIDVNAIIWVDVIKMDHPENLVIEPSDELSHSAELEPLNVNSKGITNNKCISSGAVKEVPIKTAYEFDMIDQNIIRLLSENARLPFSKIAEQLNISTQSVSRRYNKLRKTVSPYSSITLDLRKLGYVGTALFLIKVSNEQDVAKIVEEILKVPNVITAIRTLGNFDVFIAAPFSDYDDLFKINQAITGISGVKQIELLWGEPFSEWPLNIFSKVIHKEV